MRRSRLREVMALVAVVAASMALGGYLEGRRRDAADGARRAALAKAAKVPQPGQADRARAFSHFIGAFW